MSCDSLSSVRHDVTSEIDLLTFDDLEDILDDIRQIEEEKLEPDRNA